MRTVRGSKSTVLPSTLQSVLNIAIQNPEYPGQGPLHLLQESFLLGTILASPTLVRYTL